MWNSLLLSDYVYLIYQYTAVPDIAVSSKLFPAGINTYSHSMSKKEILHVKYFEVNKNICGIQS